MRGTLPETFGEVKRILKMVRITRAILCIPRSTDVNIISTWENRDISCDLKTENLKVVSLEKHECWTPKWKRLFLHHHTFPMGLTFLRAGDANNWDGMYPRIQNCIRRRWGQKPNFLSIDWIPKGDGLEILEVLHEGGVLFYEGNDATQNYVCGLGAGKNRLLGAGMSLIISLQHRTISSSRALTISYFMHRSEWEAEEAGEEQSKNCEYHYQHLSRVSA